MTAWLPVKADVELENEVRAGVEVKVEVDVAAGMEIGVDGEVLGP